MSLDPYAEWLKIPLGRRPPTYYDLLGVSEGESDLAIIQRAYADRYEQVRKYALGAASQDAQRILNELSEAVTCLSDPKRRDQCHKPEAVKPEWIVPVDHPAEVAPIDGGQYDQPEVVTPEPTPPPDADNSQKPMLSLLEEELGELPRRPKRSANETPCPVCGAGLRRNAVICLECGFDLRTGKSLSPIAAAPEHAPLYDEDVGNAAIYFQRFLTFSLVGAIMITLVLCLFALTGRRAEDRLSVEPPPVSDEEIPTIEPPPEPTVPPLDVEPPQISDEEIPTIEPPPEPTVPPLFVEPPQMSADESPWVEPPPESTVPPLDVEPPQMPADEIASDEPPEMAPEESSPGVDLSTLRGPATVVRSNDFAVHGTLVSATSSYVQVLTGRASLRLDLSDVKSIRVNDTTYICDGHKLEREAVVIFRRMGELEDEWNVDIVLPTKNALARYYWVYVRSEGSPVSRSSEYEGTQVLQFDFTDRNYLWRYLGSETPPLTSMASWAQDKLERAGEYRTEMPIVVVPTDSPAKGQSHDSIVLARDDRGLLLLVIDGEHKGMVYRPGDAVEYHSRGGRRDSRTSRGVR